MRLFSTCVFLSATVLTLPVLAGQQARCATDAFGNTVCMDQDGVTSVRPRNENDKEEKSEAGSTANEGRDGAAASPRQRRCAVDDFGNKVCAD